MTGAGSSATQSGAAAGPPHRAGIVVIGRNEGCRLRRSLASVRELGAPVVYVDSGSTDGSPALARELSVDCLELSDDQPFSAARARNAGHAWLRDRHPELDFVQFLDGDCELDPSWLPRGIQALGVRSEVALVFGRLAEAHPDASIYNRLCDMEWQHEPGEVDEALGVMLVRARAFESVGGFAAELAAGEESDLCLRLRRKGYRAFCLDVPMGRHDASMLHFSQWWTRALRNGHGCCHALIGALAGEDVELQAYDLRCLASALFWALLLPCLALVLGADVHPSGLLAAPLGWTLLYRRVRRGRLRAGCAPGHASLYARFVLLGKLADLVGIGLGAWQRLSGQRGASALRYRDRVTA